MLFRWIVLALLLVPAAVDAQAWTRRRPVLAISTLDSPATNYLVPVEISFTDGLNPDGGDIRFRAENGTTELSYYVESWNYGGTSLVWVRVPNVPAHSAATIYLYYGNPTATSTSSFPAVFPSAYQQTGISYINMSGIQNYDWFSLGPDATILGNLGSPLIINAGRVIIQGTINLTGRGYFSSLIDYDVGQGPGAGGASHQLGYGGAGGGAYGGEGGAGGYIFFPGLEGEGGPSYGTPALNDIQMGSSGGNGTFPSYGGNGGGMIMINSRRITMSGTILVNGGHSGSPADVGGGGGSGGGAMLRGYDMEMTGTIAARGGDGAITNSGDAGGGGGGGGRIKRIYGFTSTGAPTLQVNGGLGNSGGQAGAVGTTHHELIEWYEVTTAVGSEQLVVGVGPGGIANMRVGLPVPNPAWSGVALAVDLDHQARCLTEIVDVQGRRVRVLDHAMPAGANALRWDLRDADGRRVSTGVYLATVRVEGRTWSRRIVVIR